MTKEKPRGGSYALGQQTVLAHTRERARDSGNNQLHPLSLQQGSPHPYYVLSAGPDSAMSYYVLCTGPDNATLYSVLCAGPDNVVPYCVLFTGPDNVAGDGKVSVPSSQCAGLGG